MSATMINVNFSSMSGNKFTGQLRIPFTFADIMNIVKAKMGSEDYRLVVEGKELNPVTFPTVKTLIIQNTTIFILARLKGGIDPVDLAMNKEEIVSKVESEVNNITLESTTTICQGCNDKQHCIKFCCTSYLCRKCFSVNFISNGLQIKCCECRKIIPYKVVFKNPTFLDSLDSYHFSLQKLKQYVDFCICNCGVYAINETMHAKQQCPNCHRWMCAFCNQDWNERMKDELYTCGVNCVWETKISYQLVPLAYNKSIQVRIFRFIRTIVYRLHKIK